MAKVKAETLLRKIQKGSVQVGNSIKAGSSKIPGFNFDSNGKIQVFKKREIVKPYLHPIDSRMINEEIRKAVVATSQDPDVKKNYDKFLPTHLVNDLYSLYYNRTERLKFEGLDKTNEFKFKILDSINNSLLKIVTNESHISSYVYTEEIGKYLYKQFMKLDPEQQEELKKAMNNCNQGGQEDESNKQQHQQAAGPGNEPGDGKQDGANKPEKPDYDQDGSHRSDSDPNAKSERNPDNSSRGMANNSKGNNSKKDMSQEAADQMVKDLEKMLQSKSSKRELEKSLKEAEEKLDKLKEIGVDLDSNKELPPDEQKEIIKNLSNLDSIRQSLSSLSTSKDKVMKAIDKILSNASNYFSQKCLTTEVELFEADDILDINGIELLHPVFRNARIFDLSITERKYIGKVDLYVDCSGSMSSGCGGNLSGVTRIDLAKSLAMQMKELGILGDLYEFEDVPQKIMNTDISILMMNARGGTNIDSVVEKIIQTGNNSVILTDGESHLAHYTHKALFIGIGTDFHYFKNYADEYGKKFVDGGQCIRYDGKDFVVA